LKVSSISQVHSQVREVSNKGLFNYQVLPS